VSHASVMSDFPSVSSASCLRGKRVAMVLFSIYPIDPRARRAAEALTNAGMHVDLICITNDEKDPKRETVNGVDILRIPFRYYRGTKFQYLFRYSTFILISLVILAVRSLTRRYDLVYVHNMPDILVLSAVIPKVFGAKVILDLRDPMPELMMTIFNLPQDTLPVRTLKLLEKWSIQLADLALTVNLACKKLFASRSCRPEKIQVVMNSPEEKIFGFRPPCLHTSTRHSPSKPFVIMYHGSLVERNGLDLAVDALARVRQSVPSVDLRIYNLQTKFLERVMESVRAKGLHEVVHYLGLKQPEDLVEAIEECDLGIIPNQRNVFTEINTPVRIFEYLALGKPVIAPRAEGIQDYFKNESLLFFELGNSEDLARKIEYVYFHPSETVEIVKRGQEVYLAHTWRQEKLSLVNLVGELLSRDPRRGAS
jgi:glycosyltransferase involved in cell wall biosynthesis